MKKVLLIGLFALFIGISFAQTMNEMIVIKQAELRQDQIIRQDRKDRMGRVCAGLLILTDLTGLKFESNNGVVDMTYEPGRYMVFVSEGERVLDVYKEGFRPLEIILNQYDIYGLKPGQVYQLEITGKDREVDSLPVVFNVTPADARIRIGSLAFISGRAQQLPKGENEVVIEKEGYRPVREKIIVQSDNVFFTYNLQEIEPVLVKISSIPQNASIQIDNSDRGITNRDLWLYPGRYEVQLSLSGHININEGIEVKETGENTFNWNLTKNSVMLNITVVPTNAELLINNEKQKQMRGIELPPGLYRIEVQAAGHHSEAERIDLNLGETVNKSYNLKAMTGNLLLELFPANTEVELMMQGRSVRKVTGSSRVSDLFVGEYTLKAQARGYKSGEYWVTIRESETARQIITLEEGTILPAVSRDVPDNMVFVEGGTFQMGSNDGQDNQKPVHSVTVSSFYIGKFPVTQKEYQAVMGRNPSHFQGDDLPAEYVSWYDAVDYCNKLSIKEDLTPVYSIIGNISPSSWLQGTIVADGNANGYRLPTEAEWEFAARDGNKSRGYIYAGSNNVRDVAWYYNNSGRKTHPVGQKRANELGIYDMSGNVWEWCWDWYGSYTAGVKTNPRGPQTGEFTVLRGGSWRDILPSNLRVSHRGRKLRHLSDHSNGFRVTRNIP